RSIFARGANVRTVGIFRGVVDSGVRNDRENARAGMVAGVGRERRGIVVFAQSRRLFWRGAGYLDFDSKVGTARLARFGFLYARRRGNFGIVAAVANARAKPVE